MTHMIDMSTYNMLYAPEQYFQNKLFLTFFTVVAIYNS